MSTEQVKRIAEHVKPPFFSVICWQDGSSGELFLYIQVVKNCHVINQENGKREEVKYYMAKKYIIRPFTDEEIEKEILTMVREIEANAPTVAHEVTE